MFEAAEVEHSDTAICATADKDIDALGAEADVEDLFIMGDQLGLGCQGGDVPNGTGSVDARGDDQTG